MSKLPILAPAATGYKGAVSAIRTMPMVAGCAFVIMLVFNLLEYVVPFRATESVIGGIVLAIIVSALQNFCLTPVMIAVHRFIILNEVTPRYVLVPNQPAFQAFFAWLMALSVLGLLTMPLFANELDGMFSLGVILIAMVVIIVISTRLSILFPAIAVDAPGATAANAWADSKAHTFRIFLIFLLSIMPVVIFTLFVMFPFVLSADGQTGALGIPALVVLAVVQMFAVLLCVCIASRLYEALADRLLRPV